MKGPSRMSAAATAAGDETGPQAPHEDSYIHLPGNLNEVNVYKFLDLAAKSDFYHDFHVPPKKKKEGEEGKAEEEDEEDDVGKEGTSVERYLKQLSQSYDPMYENAPYNLTNPKYITAITDLQSQLVTINNTMFQMFENEIKLTLPSDGNPDILKQSPVSEEKVLAQLFGNGNIQEKILNKLANTNIFVDNKINLKDGNKLYGKYEGKDPEEEMNLKYLTGSSGENLPIQEREYNIRCFPTKIGSGSNYINLPDAFNHVSNNPKKKYVLMIDASILSFTTITELYTRFMDSKKEEGVGVSEFYILSNMEGDSDPATKFAKVDTTANPNGAKVFFLKEKNPEYPYPYKSVKLDSTSNRSILYSNANLHTVRDPAYALDKKNKKVNARVIGIDGEGLLETKDLGSVSEINKACVEAMRKFVLAGKGKDIRKNPTTEEKKELNKLMYHFMLKRAGDWCQALSLNDISREYTVTPSDGDEGEKTITLAELQAEGAEIALVTHDRILLGYALYNGLNVYYSGKRLTKYGPGGKKENIAWLLYFKNMATRTVADYPGEIEKVKGSIQTALELTGEGIDITNVNIKNKIDLIKTNYDTKIREFTQKIIDNKNISSDPADPTNPKIIDVRYQKYISELRLNTYRMSNLLPAPAPDTIPIPPIPGDATADDYKKWKAVEAYVLNLKNIEDNNSKESTPSTWEAEYTESTDAKEKKKHIITNLPSLTDSAIYKISVQGTEEPTFILQATTDKAKSYGLLVSNIFPKIIEDLKIIQRNIGTIVPLVDLTSLIPTLNNGFGNLPTTGLERLRRAQNQVQFYADIVKVFTDAGIPPIPAEPPVSLAASTGATSGGGLQSGGGTGDNNIKKIFMTRTMDTVPLTSIFYDNTNNDETIITEYATHYNKFYIDGKRTIYNFKTVKPLIKHIYDSKKNILFKSKFIDYMYDILNDFTFPERGRGITDITILNNLMNSDKMKNNEYKYSHIDRGVRLIDSNGQAFTVVDDIVFDSNLEVEMKKILNDIYSESPTLNYENKYPTTFLKHRSIIYYIDTIITRILSMYDNPQNTTPEMIKKTVKEIIDIEANPIAIENIIKNFIGINEIAIADIEEDTFDNLYRRAQVQKLRFIFEYYKIYTTAMKDNYYLKPLVDDFVFTYFYYSCRNLADVKHIETEINIGRKLASYNKDYVPPISGKKMLSENIKPVKLIYQVLEGKEITDADNNSLAQAIRFASSNAAANEAVYRLLKLYPNPGVIEAANNSYDMKNKHTIQRYRQFISQPPESTAQLTPTDISDEIKIEVTANAIRILQVMENTYKRKHEKLQVIVGAEGILISYKNNFRQIDRTKTENINKVKEEEEFCKEVNGGAEVTHVLKHLIDHEGEIEQPDENPELKEEKRNIYEEYDHYIRNFVDIITQFNNTSKEYYDSESPGTVQQLPYEGNPMKTMYDRYENAYKTFLSTIYNIEQKYTREEIEVPVHEGEFTKKDGDKDTYCTAKNAYIRARNAVIEAIMGYPQPPFNLSMALPESTNHTAHKGALTSIISVMKTTPSPYCRLYWYLKNIYVDLEDPDFETIFTVDSCTILPTETAVSAAASTGRRAGGRRTRKQRKTHKGIKTRTAKPRKQSPHRHKKHSKKTRKH